MARHFSFPDIYEGAEGGHKEASLEPLGTKIHESVKDLVSTVATPECCSKDFEAA